MSNSSRILTDRIAHKFMLGFVWVSILLLIAMGLGLFFKSWPIISQSSFSVFFSTEWAPYSGKFGLLPSIVSTLWVTGVAIIIAVPLCLLTAIYLSEYANKKVLIWVTPLIDILAGLPSIIFGIWGVILIVPLIKNFIGPFFGVDTSTGHSILAGGMVLSIMVFPIIIYVLLEVFRTVPDDLRNAALSLGANKWIMIRKVLLRKAGAGIISAIVLGFSRALGETLAVLMVVGNVMNVPSHPLEAGFPLPALIASKYHEVLSIPSYESALMLCAFVLFLVIVIFNIVARIILRRIEKKIA